MSKQDLLRRQLEEFDAWFAAKDLGPLEDVREYVHGHATENASDVELSELATVAKATVEQYLDDPAAAEVFDYYRTQGAAA